MKHVTMNSIYRMLILGFISMISSCEYEPKGAYIQDIPEPSVPENVSIGLTDIAENEIIWVRNRDLEIVCSPNLQGHDVLEMTVSLNGGDEVNMGISDQYRFKFELNQLSIGLNTVKVSMVINSNTKSIADLLHVEGYVFSKTFQIQRIPENTNNFSSLSSTIENGQLKVSWDPYPYPDFSYYLVNNQLVYEDPNQAYSICAEYVESTHDWISVDVYSGYHKVAELGFYPYYPQPDFTVEQDGDKFIFTWPKTKFYNAPIKYVIRDHSPYTPDKIWFQSSNVNDTTYVMTNPPFGVDFEVELVYLPQKESVESNKSGVYKTNLSYGESTPELLQGNLRLYDMGNKRLYCFNHDSRAMYDETSNQIVTKQDGYSWYNFTLSPNGEFLLGVDYYSMVRYNASTLESEPVDYWDNIKAHLNLDAKYWMLWADIDNHNNLYLCIFRNYPRDYQLIKYDIANNQCSRINITDNQDLFGDNHAISKDGAFAILDGYLYELQDLNATKIIDLGNAHFFDAERKVVSSYAENFDEPSRLRVYDLGRKTFDQTIDITVPRFYSFSPTGEYGLVNLDESEEELAILSLNTGEVVYKCPGGKGDACFLLSGDYLYGGNSKRISTK